MTITILSTNVSCNSFIDVHPDGELVEADIFDSQEGYEDALYGAYSSLVKNALWGRYANFYVNDILANYFYDSYALAAAYRFTLHDYEDETSLTIIENFWEYMYKSIGYANNIIDNLKADEAAKSYELYNVYYAEALAMRAFLHFEVSRYFCQNILNNSEAQGIPYKDSYDYTIAEIDNLSVTYEKIIADLKMAEELYDGNDYFDEAYSDNTFIKDRNIHFNLHAVRGLLARVYWTMGDLDNAVRYAVSVIECERFKLIESYDELTTFCAGVISAKEGVLGFFTETASDYAYNNLYVSTSAVNSFEIRDYYDLYQLDKEGIEYRYEKWFYEPSLSGMGVRCMKVVEVGQTDYAVEGVNILRLPELYYIAAEYYVSINDQVNAQKYFDPVIVSRGLTAFADRGTDITLDIINNERQKEYICEGQYFYTMKKYNMDSYDSTYGVYEAASDEFYVFPWPSSEVDYRSE